MDEYKIDLLVELFEQLLNNRGLKKSKLINTILLRQNNKVSNWMIKKSQRKREKVKLLKIKSKPRKQTLENYIKKINSFNENLMPIKNFEGLRICLTTKSVG